MRLPWRRNSEEGSAAETPPPTPVVVEKSAQAPAIGKPLGPAQAVAAAESSPVDAWLRALGMVFSNMGMYGPSHVITCDSIPPCHQFLCRVFETLASIEISLINDEFLVDGKRHDGARPVAFVRKLAKLPVHSFRLSRGLSLEEFTRFVILIDGGAAGGGGAAAMSLEAFMEKLNPSDLPHVVARNVTYRAVEEHQVVMAKAQAERLATIANRKDLPSHPLPPPHPPATAAPAVAPPLPAPPAEPPPPALDVERIVAFLKGDTSAPSAAVGEAIRQGRLDMDRLAELIVRAAAEESPDGGSLGGTAAGCARRAIDELIRGARGRTAVGAKAAAATAATLERLLLERLRGLGRAGIDRETETVVQTFEQWRQGLDTAVLVTQFKKTQDSFARVRKQLRRHIESRCRRRLDDPETRAILTAAGLNEEDWRQLAAEHPAHGNPP